MYITDDIFFFLLFIARHIVCTCLILLVTVFLLSLCQTWSFLHVMLFVPLLSLFSHISKFYTLLAFSASHKDGLVHVYALLRFTILTVVSFIAIMLICWFTQHKFLCYEQAWLVFPTFANVCSPACFRQFRLYVDMNNIPDLSFKWHRKCNYPPLPLVYFITKFRMT